MTSAAVIFKAAFSSACGRCMLRRAPLNEYFNPARRNFYYPRFINIQQASTTSNSNNAELIIPIYAHTKVPSCVSKMLQNDMIVVDDFISEAEEKLLLDEISPYMARLHYEYSHWDDAIHGYRETERSKWNAENTSVINRLKEAAFCNVAQPTEFVHVLDLEKDGEIKPHKDSVRFCGDTIAGLSLMSSSVMRLVAENNDNVVVDILLKPRSLYIMRNSARYDFTHAILHNEQSYFKSNHIEKGRRVSIICRNLPMKPDDG